MYEEGDIADGPNGPLIFRGGRWQPLSSTAAPAAPGMVVKRADPSAGVDVALKQARLAQMARDASRTPIQQQADEIQLQRQRLALEKDQRLATAPTAGKPLREGDGDKLEKDVGTYAALKGALGSFNDAYAGSVFAGMENTGQRLLGTGTPGQSDWWSNFRTTDNQIRNALFGASLTDGEKQAYEATTISPSMRPDLIRTNLARRAEIIRNALGRKVNRLKAGGYNPAEIDAATGDFAPDLAPGFKPTAAKQSDSDKTALFYANAADNGGSSGRQAQLADGPTRTEADPVLKGVNAKVNGMLKTGKSDQDILGYLKQVGANASPASVAAALDFRRKNPGYKGNYSVNLEDREIPMSAARQAFQSVGGGPVGSYAVGAADALTAGRLDNIAGAVTGDSEQVQAAKALLAKANPLSSLAGNVTGGALATAGLEFGLARSGLQAATGLAGRLARSPVAADALYGGAMGSDEGGALGAAGGALAGVVGGALGQRAAGALGGVRNEAVTALRDRGIPLTLGQAVGGSGRVGAAVKAVEDRLSGIPVVGSFANARRLESMQGYNRAAFDEALAPVAGDTAGVIGPAGVDAAQNVVGNAYDNALDGVNVRADMPFVRDIVGAVRSARRLPGEMANNADYTLRERVGASFTPTRELSGRNYQQSLRGLRRDAAKVEDLPYGYDFGQVTGQAEDALDGLLQRQAPGVVDAKRAADRAFRQTEIIRNAVNRARNGSRSGQMGTFAPSQLVDAAAQNAERFGGNAGTTNQPFYALNSAAQDVLPNTVPDSGTAGRLILGSALVGGGAGAGYLGEDTQKGAAAGAALAALQTQMAQRALVRLVLDRPDIVRRASDFAVRNRIGGALGTPIGAGLALQALPSR